MYAKYIVQCHFKSESSIPIIGDKEQHAIPVKKRGGMCTHHANRCDSQYGESTQLY